MIGGGVMSKILHPGLLFEPLGVAMPSFGALFSRKIRQLKFEPTEIFWWCFLGAVTAASTLRYLGDVSGPLYYLLTIGGTAACGWAWFFARALFRPKGSFGKWPIFAMVGIIAFESLWGFTSGLSIEGVSGEVRRLASNTASLICISALAFVFVEAISGYNAQSPTSERRFRQTFVFLFGAFIAVTMVIVRNADEGTFFDQWKDVAIYSSVVVLLIGGRMAIAFRKNNPLPASRGQSRSKFATRAVGDTALARRIVEAIERDNFFTTQNIKVADLAAKLGEHDYKITQCITGLLQFRNFNHFINSYRVDHARRMLLDHDDDRAILAIAFDCGFNSIGTFNRAFKEIVGMSPREFRSSRSSPAIENASAI